MFEDHHPLKVILKIRISDFFYFILMIYLILCVQTYFITTLYLNYACDSRTLLYTVYKMSVPDLMTCI